MRIKPHGPVPNELTSHSSSGAVGWTTIPRGRADGSHRPREVLRTEVKSGKSPRAGWKPFVGLPGIEDLHANNGKNGGGSWGNFKKDNIALGQVLICRDFDGSVNMWKANGKKNSNTKPLRTGRKAWIEPIEAIQDQDLRAPGVFDIPVCTVLESQFNSLKQRGVARDKRSYAFPCA
ncbi:hypothetical protein CPLU01_11041 [Colletotrichum plurivorum]|uniref:Uncharacterized protein n=1 Tax=Colletotrichum plurivorum TaxID=2175906 RepID=A0A8H6K309_9PEZI|nr:hypothetical protein CPLU01_11041 [Colletotrichum plurivorum]